MRRIVVLVLMAVVLIACSGFSSCYLWLDDDEDEEHEHHEKRCNEVINSTSLSLSGKSGSIQRETLNP
jgi:hypothetical protein